MDDKAQTRIAAVADIHYSKTSKGKLRDLFVSVDHALRLGEALTNLVTEKKVVILHYSPIRSTVKGENTEIDPFLGTSHLEATINQFGASVVFHGHAHNGEVEGKTASGVPVFNVALPVLLRSGKGPFLIYKV